MEPITTLITMIQQQITCQRIYIKNLNTEKQKRNNLLSKTKKHK